jgi:hypothetical protein
MDRLLIKPSFVILCLHSPMQVGFDDLFILQNSYRGNSSYYPI